MAVAFPQQGAVDWVTLSSNAANLSIQLLQRISTHGVDAYTILVGQIVCGNLVCGSDGRQRFVNALKVCNGLAGYRNTLWFGFGIKHIASALTATDQGTSCAALCASLAECYSTDFAAEILMEMTRESVPPNEPTPSLLQWLQLIRSCAGLVTKSTFGIRAEQMMRLAGERRIAFEDRRHGQNSYTGDRGVAHKLEIARTLLGLGKLSRGQLFQMTVVGGADAGFIAAIADWLLDIRVEIRGWEDITIQHQEIVFRSRNCGPDQEPQLLVIYEKDVSKNSLHCVGQTYRLPDAHQMIRKGETWTQAALLSGRVPWQNAFEYTYSRDFKKLMSLGDAAGSVIGSAARIYQGLIEADDLPRQWLNDCRSYYPDSYGTNYLSFTLTRFPELEPLRDAMYPAARVDTLGEAMSNFDTHMRFLAAECGCCECCSKDVYLFNKGTFCLVYLAHAIIRTSRALSGIITELCPMRAGLEAMYWNIYRHPSIPATAQVNIMEQAEELLWHGGVGPKALLCAADAIFGGDRIRRINVGRPWTNAIAENGLCYFFDILVEPSFGASQAARVHVVPGRIEYMDRAYNWLSDIDNNIPPYVGKLSPGWKLTELDGLTKGHNGRLETLIEERVDGLSIKVRTFQSVICLLAPCLGLRTHCKSSHSDNTHQTFSPPRLL